MGAIAESASVSAAFIIPVIALFAASALVRGASRGGSSAGSGLA